MSTPLARSNPPSPPIRIQTRYHRTAVPTPGVPLGEGWREVIDRLDHAFQPIVNVHTGFCFGYEALLRNVDQAGFDSIHGFFDACHAEGVLAEVEAALCERAVAKFAAIPHHRKVKLFLNIDNRVEPHPLSAPQGIVGMLDARGLAATDLALELSERQPFAWPPGAGGKRRRPPFKLAIDDFGVGHSGLETLHACEPDFIKLDRFFMADIATDARKKVMLSHVVSVAHLLGIVVIAEGVETEREFFACKAAGCDLVQGWLVARPDTAIEALALEYPHVEALSRSDRRSRQSDEHFVTRQMDVIDPLPVDTGMNAVFQHFRANRDQTFLPVVDAVGAPLGIVRERDLKQFIYSAFGRDLIANKAFGYTLAHFLSKCPIADLHTPAERLIESFSAIEDSDGIMIVEDMRYIGFLSARSLLRVINEKNVAVARDQNPLTKLPGNGIIHEKTSEALADRAVAHAFIYFDFDNFKPFNDKYGFRQGDRAILLFAEILDDIARRHGFFVGHIGGDDFFASCSGLGAPAVEQVVEATIARFGEDVRGFYDQEAREAGHIEALDRDGNRRRFPLLTVSACILSLPAGRGAYSLDEVARLIADIKKLAKVAPDKIARAAV
ncbi:MAG: GGDEF domain-containing protein [Alphaproteobacteria bacterium]|nr:GGDEF domain-containing protein [Alphaproteobacteria bacterium]